MSAPVELQAITTILNSLDAVVYVADLETHKLLFINEHGKQLLNRPDVHGLRCWEVLQKEQQGPCDFCTNDRLLDSDGQPNGVYVWEFCNTVNGRWYQCRDQAIHWIDGRLVRIEIATDITDRKRLEEELREAKRQAEELARIDELTQLYNRRAFFELGAMAFRQARRGQRSLSVLLLDADHFKRINDIYGHFAGDQVLRMLARRMRELTRDSDVLGRLGGEEFALVLPDSTTEQALAIAERLRETIAETLVEVQGQQIQCTVSVGVASLREDSTSLEALLHEADRALYQTKRGGRNRVEHYQDTESS